MASPVSCVSGFPFWPPLDRIIALDHLLARLAGEIDWGSLERRFSAVCSPGPGQTALPAQLVAGLFFLKHMHGLSDEVLCARWLENPYYQFFCGEACFRHGLPFGRSSLTRWRQRLGEQPLVALIQESLSVAHKTGAQATRDLERVAVDTAVQPKAITHPTDARLIRRALAKLVELAKRESVLLRQSYLRLAKRTAIMVGRYSHTHQFKRARRALKFLRTRLGRVIRVIERKIAGDPALEGRASTRCSASPARSGCRTSASAAPRSIRSTPPRSSASARASRMRLMNLGARSPSPPRSPSPRVASSSSIEGATRP